MSKFYKMIVEKLGIDKAIAYSSGSRIISGVAGVLSVFFISTFLTGVEQGFYYTFGSILALQVFFELGLTGIMTQYVAHEASHLEQTKDGEYVGEEIYKSRLASLIHFCLKWYSVIAIVAFVVLIIVGFVFFNKYGKENEGVSWEFPWILICIGTSIKILQSPFISILNGLGKVKEMSKIGFWLQIILHLVNWIGLACGLKLYVLGISYIASVIVWQLYIWITGLGGILVKLWKTRIKERVSYMKEIFPYQWKIALSWVSGYFISQLFNPVLFATEGAVVAGQMGLTMQALGAVSSLSMSWLNTKIPLYSGLIARKEYYRLDEIFNRTLYQMITVCISLLMAFLAFLWLLDITKLQFGESMLFSRFLPYLPTIILMLAILSDQFVGSWATYLRCHKQEPFLILSIVMGCLCCLSTICLGNLYGLYGIIIGYAVLKVFISIPWGHRIFVVKRKEWHNVQE